MIDVAYVYNTVRDLCNKDQKGFVTPAVFNTFARLAQENVFNEMFDELKLATRLRGGASDAGRDKSAYKQVEEDLSYFITRVELTNSNDETVVQENGSFEAIEEGPFMARKPLDLARVIGMRDLENNQFEIVYDADKISRILSSDLSAPTFGFPVAFVSSRHIEVYPSALTTVGVELIYYRQPRSSFVTDVFTSLRGEVDYNSFPRFSALTVDESSGFVVQNPTDSRNFELPEHYTQEIISEILSMLGVRLRDQTLLNSGETNKQAN